jgi:hypothetical protein
MDFLDQFLIPFIVGILSSSIVVLFGVNSLKEFSRKKEREKELGNLRSYWEAGSSSYLIICGKESALNDSEMEPRLGYSEAFGIMLISEILNKLYGNRARVNVKLVDPDEKLGIDNIDSNVIIFGSELSVNGFRDLSDAAEVPYYQFGIKNDSRSFQRKQGESVIEELSTIADYEKGKIDFDYGTAVRIKNKTTKNLLVLLNGNHCAGLMAAINLITDKDLLEKSCFLEDALAQISIVGVNVEGKELVMKDTEIDIVKQWTKFPVDIDKINNAIQDL